MPSRTIASVLLLLFSTMIGPVAVLAADYEIDGQLEIHVRFVKGSDLSAPMELLSDQAIPFVDVMYPLFPLPSKTLDELVSVSPELPDLKCWFLVKLSGKALTTDVATLLRGQPNIDVVEEVSTNDVADEPSYYDEIEQEESIEERHLQSSNTPDLEYRQRYLNSVGATFARNITGGKGETVTVYDIEYDWNQEHEDISKAANVERLIPGGSSVLLSPFGNNNHGTAVLGVIVGDDNGFGISGISPAVNVGLVPQRNRLPYGIINSHGAAVLRAMTDGKPGDIILLETQSHRVCGSGLCSRSAGDTSGCGPSEWLSSNFDAIEIATARGFIVVEAAGNSGINLDGEGCRGVFDRNKRDSGAILVGAGSRFGRTKYSFSNFGNRVDVQGWGRFVATSGYGSGYKDPSDLDNKNRWYTFSFGGTSSASAIVAGVAASLQGMAKAMLDRPLTPKEMREVGCCAAFEKKTLILSWHRYWYRLDSRNQPVTQA